MTPQERQLVSELFDRLESLEATPRDAEAERAIADGLRRARHAVYALVQTALVQDEALKRADARIRELQGESGPPQEGGFLGSMRNALFGGDSPSRGSVPSVRPGMAPPSAPYAGAAPSYAQQPSAGGSFLGTAASAAAGVIGGALLMDGIRSMFGGQRAGMFDPGLNNQANPWGSGGSAADSDLARQAGFDDVDRGGSSSERAGFFDTADNSVDDGGSGDFDDGFDMGGDGGSDVA